MKVLKAIGKIFIAILFLATIVLAHNPTIQLHITNLIDKLI